MSRERERLISLWIYFGCLAGIGLLIGWDVWTA